jgi:hypothetical protein
MRSRRKKEQNVAILEKNEECEKREQTKKKKQRIQKLSRRKVKNISVNFKI